MIAINAAPFRLNLLQGSHIRIVPYQIVELNIRHVIDISGNRRLLSVKQLLYKLVIGTQQVDIWK